jgi:hypothetical protein
MKKIYLSLFKIILSLVILFSFTPLVYAQLGEYSVLTPLPNTTAPCTADPTKSCTKLATYLPAVFSLSIGIGAAMAVVMITYGGILYATTDAINGKEEGKKYITDAIVGLLLILSSWIILVTINPNMVNFSLILPKPKVIPDAGGITPGGGTPGNGKVLPGYPLTTEQIALNAKMVLDLENNYKVLVNTTYACEKGETSGCTNLVGMPGEAFNGVVSVKRECGNGCRVTITGGTEGGHITHGPNLPRLDLSKDPVLDAYIINNAFNKTTLSNGDIAYSVRTATGAYIFVDEKGGAPHWHVDFAGR